MLFVHFCFQLFLIWKCDQSCCTFSYFVNLKGNRKINAKEFTDERLSFLLLQNQKNIC